MGSDLPGSTTQLKGYKIYCQLVLGMNDSFTLCLTANVLPEVGWHQITFGLQMTLQGWFGITERRRPLNSVLD